jgi:hypothetical protein
MGASLETPITSLDFSKMNPSKGTTRVEVTIEFTDGSILLRTKFPFVPIPDLTVRTTTTTKAPVPPQCESTILASVLTTCKPFKEYGYSWHDDTKRLSPTMGSQLQVSTTKLVFGTPLAGATRVQVRIVFTDWSRMEWTLFRLGTTTKEPAIPGKPIAPTANAGNGNAVVNVAAGSGGSPTSYQVTSTPGDFTCTVTGFSGNCTIGGLTNGTSYTFSATAINASGTSEASAASNAVTPVAPVKPTTTTVAPATTTTLAIVRSQCEISVQNSILTACAPIKSFTYVFSSHYEALTEQRYGSAIGTAQTTEDFNMEDAPTGTRRVEIRELELIDGRKVRPFSIPYKDKNKVTFKAEATIILIPTTTLPVATTTTLPPCKISISSQGLLTTCKKFIAFAYSFWDDTKSVSERFSGESPTAVSELKIPRSTIATRIRISLKFSDGKSYKDIFIPYANGKATSILMP